MDWTTERQKKTGEVRLRQETEACVSWRGSEEAEVERDKGCRKMIKEVKRNRKKIDLRRWRK